MELTKTEELLMEYIWKHEKSFLKDLIDCFPEPKPAQTTVATMLKRMQEKGFVGYELYGNSRCYYALVKKTDYFSKQVKTMVRNFFNDSAGQFASFFTSETNLSKRELEDIRMILDEKIKNSGDD